MYIYLEDIGGLTTAYKYEQSQSPSITKYNYTGVEIVDSTQNAGYEYTQISSYPTALNRATTIGTDIYLQSATKLTKYDTLTDTYTQLTDIPYVSGTKRITSVGTDIYLFGGNDKPTTAYKYNTLTDTYTQLTNIPYSFYGRGNCYSWNKYIFIWNLSYIFNKSSKICIQI